jgi:excisionase family DNA binding protein
VEVGPDGVGRPLDREELISLSDAAALSGLSLKHLGLLARQGKLRARKIGRNWVTSKEAVEEYVRDSFKRSRDPFKSQRR